MPIGWHHPVEKQARHIDTQVDKLGQAVSGKMKRLLRGLF
jgi:hypothetical protein